MKSSVKLKRGQLDLEESNGDNIDLSPYAKKTWVEQQGYLKRHQSLSKYTQKDKAETITKPWSFQEGIMFGQKYIYPHFKRHNDGSKKYIIIETDRPVNVDGVMRISISGHGKEYGLFDLDIQFALTNWDNLDALVNNNANEIFERVGVYKKDGKLEIYFKIKDSVDPLYFRYGIEMWTDQTHSAESWYKITDVKEASSYASGASDRITRIPRRPESGGSFNASNIQGYNSGQRQILVNNFGTIRWEEFSGDFEQS